MVFYFFYLTEFWHVGEWSIDPEPCRCVRIGQHLKLGKLVLLLQRDTFLSGNPFLFLVLESGFPPDAAPVPGIGNPK